MSSAQSKLFRFLLRLAGKKNSLRKQLAAGKFDFFSCPRPRGRILKTCHIKRSKLGERNIFTISPAGKNSSGKHILYLHGGAYVQCFNRFHWNFLEELVNKTGCMVTAPDYPLAPMYTYKEAFAMVTAIYMELASAVKPADLILMGDSSGGGFALALAQKMKNENMVLHSQVILLSPWLDITLTNPGINDIDPLDPFLHKESLQQVGKLYAGDTDATHYLLSPVNGPLDGVGKLSVFAGSNEILAADTRKLKRLAASKGTELDYYEYKDMVHAWMFLHFPESKKAKQQVMDMIMR